MMSQIRYSCEIQMDMLVINILQFISLGGWGVERGGGRDQNQVYLQKVVFCVNLFLKSKQPCIRKNLYLDQSYHVGLAFVP